VSLTGFFRRALPVAVAVAFAAAPSTPSAAGTATPASVPGAVTPGWRITQFLPSVGVGGLAVTGARDAWLAGDLCGADSLCDHLIVRHWDGKAWRTVAPPRGVSGVSYDAGVGAVSAGSASNAWVFDQHGAQSVDYTAALHWTGKGWAAPVRLTAAISAAVEPSASDVWAFGSRASDPQGGYITHLSGRTWTHAPFPVDVDSASALSASDIWAGGSASDVTGASVVIEHWNGTVWRKTPIPSLGIKPSSWVFVSITAITSRDAWAEVDTLNSPTGSSTYLLRWNGKAWARVAFSCQGNAISPVASDGHGGVWVASGTSLPSLGTEWFCHDSDGHWTKTAVPKRAGAQPGIDNLAWIPRTRSLWATGGFDADAGEAILEYGH
jgi:hypothetical protein